MHKLKTTKLNAFLIRGKSREIPFLLLAWQCYRALLKEDGMRENENRGC